MDIFWILILVLAVLFFAALFMVWPAKLTDTQRKSLKGYFYAHRGYHSAEKGIPENSMQAFLLAMRRGYGIELDLRMTADGQIVVFHDETLARMCRLRENIDTGGSIHELTFPKIRQYRLQDTDQRVPLISEVLEAITGKVPLMIEIKIAPNTLGLCEKLAPLLEKYQGAFSVISFDPAVLAWFKKNMPSVLRGQLSGGLSMELPAPMRFYRANLLCNIQSKPHFISYHYPDLRQWGLRLCRLFKPVVAAWTVREQDILEALESRFDIIVFEGFDPKAGVRKERTVRPARGLRR